MRMPFLAIVFGCQLLSGCMIHRVAPYDDVLDAGMLSVQQDTEYFFNKAGADYASSAYGQTGEFYARTEAKLHILELRAQSMANNQRVATQIHDIDLNLTGMQELNRTQGMLSPAYLQTEHAILASQFRSFFAAQLALKFHFTQPLATPQTAPPLRP